LVSKHPDYIQTAWAQLCVARLYAASEDWTAWDANLKNAATPVGDPNACNGLELNFMERVCAPICGVSVERMAMATLAPDNLCNIAKWAQAMLITGDGPEPGTPRGPYPLRVVIGGEFAGNKHELDTPTSRYETSSGETWHFHSINLDSGAIEDSKSFDLTTLSKHGVELERWYAALPARRLVIGAASGEAVFRLSIQNRRMLQETFGLISMPEDASTCAFAFVSMRDDDRLMQFETLTSAIAMPAVIVIR
jgi:hypothetical protein